MNRTMERLSKRPRAGLVQTQTVVLTYASLRRVRCCDQCGHAETKQRIDNEHLGGRGYVSFLADVCAKCGFRQRLVREATAEEVERYARA